MVRGAALATGGVLLGGAAEIGSAPAALAASEPTIYHRGYWKARRPKQSIQVMNARPDHIVVHHTATGNVTDYSQGHAFALSRAIQNYHMDSNGWNDTGQQLTISRGGYIMEGRSQSLPAITQRRHVVGAHVANHNSHTVGIENEGIYTSATPPAALMASLVETCAWLCVAYGLNPRTAIVGHRDYNATSCPGDRLYAMLPQLRTDVATRIARLKQMAAPVEGAAPEENHPTFPDTPQEERTAEYYHGPTLGGGDTSR